MGYKRIIAFDYKGRPIMTFKSKLECEEILGISEHSLNKAIRTGKRDFETGYFYDFELTNKDIYE